MSGSILQWWGGQVFTNNGVPAAGYKLFFYASGTSTKLDTYSDYSLSSANTNPVILDASGRATIFLQNALYDVILATPTAGDPPSGAEIIESALGVQGSGTIVESSAEVIDGICGVDLVAGDWAYCSDSTGVLGRWYKTDATIQTASESAPLVGICTVAGTLGNTTTFLVSGDYDNPTYGGLPFGNGLPIYLSTTAGRVTTVPPTSPNYARVVAFKKAMPVFQNNIITLNFRQVTIAASISKPGILNTGVQIFPTGVKAIQPGTGADVAVLGGVLSVNTTAVGNVGGGEDTLQLYVLKANSLNSNLRAVRIKAWGTMAANANAKRVRMYIGSTAIGDSGSFNWNGYTWTMEGTIVRTGASAEECFAEFRVNVPIVGFNNTATRSTAAVNLGADANLYCTGLGVADNDIVQNGMIVEVLG